MLNDITEIFLVYKVRDRYNEKKTLQEEKNMKYKALLFDLDGTLTASGEGITKSVQYALEKMGMGDKAQDLKALEVFIGPPLLQSYMKYCSMTEEQAKQAVIYYRERYNVTGLFENMPYDGIQELLQKASEKRYILAVASSKPDELVKKILEHFHLDGYFQVIVGSDKNQLKMTKADVIEIALERLGMKEERRSAVMIGDRDQDVNGAKTAGLDCIGVTYGYGSRGELEEAGADRIADTPEELGCILELQGGQI